MYIYMYIYIYIYVKRIETIAVHENECSNVLF